MVSDNTKYKETADAVSGLSNMLKSFTKTFRSSPSRSLPLSVNPIIVGSNLINKAEILNNLKHGSTSDKIKTIKYLKTSIERVSISSIPEIWYLVKDNIDPKVPQDLRRDTLELFDTCIILSDNVTPTKLSYYKDIVQNCEAISGDIDPDFDLFLNCLEQLTAGGRDIYDLFMYELVPFYKFIISILLLIKKTPGQEKLKNDFIIFIGNCLKFNFNLFEASELSGILVEILEITSLTNDSNTLRSSLSLINSFVIFGSIPPNLLYYIVSLLGSAKLLQDPQINNLTNTISNNVLSNSNIFFLTVLSICDVISCKKLPPGAERNNKSIIGCLQFMTHYVTKFREDSVTGKVVTDVLNNSVTIIINCLISASDLKDVEISTEILDLVSTMLKNDVIEPMYLVSSDSSSLWKLLSTLQLRESSNEKCVTSISKLYKQLEGMAPSSIVTPKVVDLLENSPHPLAQSNIEFVLQYYSNHMLCICLTPNWLENCRKLIASYYAYSPLNVVRLIKNSYIGSVTLTDDPLIVKEYLGLIFNDCFSIIVATPSDNKEEVSREIYDSIIELLPEVDDTIFENLLVKFLTIITTNSEFSIMIAESLVHLTLVVCQNSLNQKKASKCFECLLDIARYSLDSSNYDMFLITARLFIRIRCTSNDEGHYLYFIQVNDVDGLCDTLGRNLDTITNPMEKQEMISKSKWFFPENSTLPYLPHELLINCNKKCLKRNGLSRWLEMTVEVLENFYDWEAYSYILGHLCPQLADTNLFSARSSGSIVSLIRTLCQQLQLKFPASFTLSSAPSVSRADIQVAILRTFSSVTAYKHLLSKSDEDHLINSVIIALQSWDKTGIPSIHFLNISCYEFPDSIKKFLNPILTILQTRISNPLTSAPILDFLLSLSEMPTLLSNFTVEEFKRIFGIAFKYIQYSNDTIENKKVISLDYNDSAIDKLPSTKNFEITKQLLLYLTTLSYRVISGWFLKLSLDERKKLSSFIIKQMLSMGVDSPRNLTFIELITRFTFSEIDLKSNILLDSSKLDQDDRYFKKSWLYGTSIFTVYTHRISGENEVLIRKPTTVSRFKISLDKEFFPEWLLEMQEETTTRRPTAELETIFTPSFLMTQLLYQSKSDEKSIKPIPLMEDDSIARSISMFDRIPIVNFSKIGIMYVAPNQTTESEILSNKFGSGRYQSFVNELGQLIKLKNCKKYYVGGLDTVDNQDGEFAINYQTEISQVCFHVTTMMPNFDDDPYFNNKKKHIGNDFVNIYWNESNLPAINKVSSQFNFINIVIEPRDAPSDFYKVKTFRKVGIPGIFSTSHFKLISGRNLANFIRSLCSTSAQFSDVWNDPNWGFNWERRLQQLNLIRARNDKLIKDMSWRENNKMKQVSEDDEKTQKESKENDNIGQSFIDQLNGVNPNNGKSHSDETAGRISGGIGSVASAGGNDQYEFLGDEESNEFYRNLEINSFN